jgi:hypothetical protein
MASAMTLVDLGPVAEPCSEDIDRILAGGRRRRPCGRLDCLECGRLALVNEVGAVISVLRRNEHSHDAIVLTLHGIDPDATAEQVGTHYRVVQRAFEALHDRYVRLDVWWTTEQSAEGIANVHGLTIGNTPKRSAMRAALEEALDLGLKPVVSYEPIRYPTWISCYAAKIALFSLAATDCRDGQDTLDYALALGGGAFARHTAAFFGDPDEPWTNDQIRRRGLYRASTVLRWAISYPHFREKLPPLLVKRLRRPPWPMSDVAAGLSDVGPQFAMDDRSANFILEGVDL